MSSVARFPVIALMCCLLLTMMIGWGVAQQSAREFKQALPGYQYHFPQEHAAHPDYKTEWWYYTGHLKTAEGRTFGYELTFFRSAVDAIGEQPLQSKWVLKEIYPAHFAISDEENRQFHYWEKLNREGLDVAGAKDTVYSVWNETWFAEQLGDQQVIRADSPDYALHLLLSSEKPPVVHGTQGVSQKGSCTGCASHYYSMTRLKSTGVLYLQGKPVPVTGESWMDHEFGSNQLGENQVGWDWFSIQLANGAELMLYQLRQADGQSDANSSGTWVPPTGPPRHLTQADFQIRPTATWKSPQSPGTYPMAWQITIPSEKLSLTLKPTFEGQELVTRQSTGVTYWEGSVSVKGLENGKNLSGKGYVEMTGYAQPFRQRI